MKSSRYILLFAFLTYGPLNACIKAVDEQGQQAAQTSSPQAKVVPVQQPEIVDLAPDAYEARMQQFPEAILIDARTPAEFALGHIPGAINVDVKNPRFEAEIQKLDTSKVYFVNCKSGIRSTRACKIMQKNGFNQLYNLEGGILAWEKSGKPIEK